MVLKEKHITFSFVLNIGLGFVKSDVGVIGEYKFKSKIFMLPFFAITYTKVFVGNID